MQNPLYHFYKVLISKKYIQKTELIFHHMGGSISYSLERLVPFEKISPKILVDIDLDVLKSPEVEIETELKLILNLFIFKNLSFSVELYSVANNFSQKEKLELQSFATLFLFQVQRFMFHDNYCYPYFMKGVFLLGGVKEYRSLLKKIGDSHCIFLNGSEKSEKYFICLSAFFELVPNADIFEVDKKLKMEEPFVYQLEGNLYYFVPELAKLSLDDQKYLLGEQSKYQEIFLLSSYKLVDLKKLNWMTSEFALFCEINHVILSRYTYPEKKGILYFLNAFLPEIKQVIQIFPLLHYLEESDHEIDLHFFSRLKLYYYMLGDKHFTEMRSVITELESFIIIFLRKEFSLSQYEISDLLGISRGSLQHKLRKYNLL